MQPSMAGIKNIFYFATFSGKLMRVKVCFVYHFVFTQRCQRWEEKVPDEDTPAALMQIRK